MPIPTAELLAEVPALDDQAAAAMHELHAQLVAERADRERLQSELDLRNSALDSARSHVMVIDVCREKEPDLRDMSPPNATRSEARFSRCHRAEEV